MIGCSNPTMAELSNLLQNHIALKWVTMVVSKLFQANLNKLFHTQPAVLSQPEENIASFNSSYAGSTSSRFSVSTLIFVFMFTIGHLSKPNFRLTKTKIHQVYTHQTCKTITSGELKAIKSFFLQNRNLNELKRFFSA